MGLIKALFRPICLAIDGVAYVIATLLVSFGLWVPVAFTAVFFIVLAANGVAFDGMSQVLFYLGLGLSIVGGLAFAFYFKRWQRIKEKNKEQNSKLSKRSNYAAKQDAVQEDNRFAEQDNSWDEQEENTPKLKRRKKNASFEEHDDAPNWEEEYYKLARQQSLSRQNASSYEKEERLGQSYAHKTYDSARQKELERRFIYDAEYVKNGTEDTSERSQTHEGLAGKQSLWQRLMSEKSEPQEQPMAFVLKSDPNIYVYEYSDRLQYFKRYGNKMTLIRTEYKHKDE